MKKITYAELLNVLRKPGAQIVGITAKTNAKARKNPIGEISKRVRMVGFVGANYAKAVQREAVRQDSDKGETFVAGKLPWGTWEIPGKVIRNGEKLYLRTQTTPGQRKRQSAKILGYFDARGNAVDEKQITDFLPVEAGSKKQANVGVGDEASAKNQIMPRNYEFASIEKVCLGGTVYALTEK